MGVEPGEHLREGVQHRFAPAIAVRFVRQHHQPGCEAGASYKVAKNRLAKLALKDTDYTGLDEFLSGPTALAWSEDPVAAAKAAVDFAKSNDKLEIVGGSMGTQVLDEAGVKALASMPSLDELRGKLVGLVNAPATKVAQVVNAPANKLARVFGAYGASEAA